MSKLSADIRVSLGRDLKALKEADRMLWLPSIFRNEAKFDVVWNGRHAIRKSAAQCIDLMGGMAGEW